jgi:hypothetical protein
MAKIGLLSCLWQGLGVSGFHFLWLRQGSTAKAFDNIVMVIGLNLLAVAYRILFSNFFFCYIFVKIKD